MQIMSVVAVQLCSFVANWADFFANCAVLMQIVTFTFHNLRCFVANDMFCVAKYAL